jgi:dihydrofolate reductase
VLNPASNYRRPTAANTEGNEFVDQRKFLVSESCWDRSRHFLQYTFRITLRTLRARLHEIGARNRSAYCSDVGLLTFSFNITLDGCVDHTEGIADDETHAFYTQLMQDADAMLWGRVTYEMMESYWPAVASGAVDAAPAMREWAAKLEAKPKYVVSATRHDFAWVNSHHLSGDLRTAVGDLKQSTSGPILLGSGGLATELDRLELIDEYRFLVHPRIAGHGPTLFEGGLLSTRCLDLVSVVPLQNGAVALHYRRSDRPD